MADYKNKTKVMKLSTPSSLRHLVVIKNDKKWNIKLQTTICTSTAE